MGKSKRISGYFSWHAAEVAVSIGLAPLIVFPLCRYYSDPEVFGQFVYALGIVSLIGLAPTKGLNNALLREIADFSGARRSALLRTSFVMGTGAVAGIAALGILACLGNRIAGTGDPRTTAWITVLIVALAARNLTTFCTIDLTADRRFATRAVWRSIGTGLTLLAIPALLLFGPWGLPLSYTAAYVIAFVVLLAARSKVYIGRPQFDVGIAKRVSAVWVILAVSTVFLMSTRYVHRTMLGAFDESKVSVTIFFAAAATLELFAMPLATLSVFGFQLLSAHRTSRRFSAKLFRTYMLAAIAGALCLYGIVVLLAPWPLRLLYPKDAAAASGPMSIMMIGVAATVLTHASRPFIMKFASPRALLALALVSVGAHLSAAVILIPQWGLRGAAWAYSLGNVIAGLVWFSFFVSRFGGWRAAETAETLLDENTNG